MYGICPSAKTVAGSGMCPIGRGFPFLRERAFSVRLRTPPVMQIAEQRGQPVRRCCLSLPQIPAQASARACGSRQAAARARGPSILGLGP